MASMARALGLATARIQETLEYAKASAHIGDLPRYDWTPNGNVHKRVPVPSAEDLEFSIKKMFRLTPLEAAFLLALIKFDHADKARLHGIIEHQRHTRAQQPDALEQTDQKMVDVMICKLRKRLKAVDSIFEIKTVWGTGYYIEKTIRAAILERLTGATGAAA